MSEEKKLPERVWCNLYTNNDDSTKGRYHYYTFETEEASHQWRRLANYVCTATFVPESSLAAAREEGLEIAARIATEHALENGPSENHEMGGHAIAAKIRAATKGIP